MSPEERDRLIKTEVRVDLLEKDFQALAKAMKENFEMANNKLDNITQLISASKGAWKALAVAGSVITVIGGFIAGLVAIWTKLSAMFEVH